MYIIRYECDCQGDLLKFCLPCIDTGSVSGKGPEACPLRRSGAATPEVARLNLRRRVHRPGWDACREIRLVPRRDGSDFLLHAIFHSDFGSTGYSFYPDNHRLIAEILNVTPRAVNGPSDMATYAYNGMGDRLQETVNPSPGSPLRGLTAGQAANGLFISAPCAAPTLRTPRTASIFLPVAGEPGQPGHLRRPGLCDTRPHTGWRTQPMPRHARFHASVINFLPE
jgi:hypothetical protein